MTDSSPPAVGDIIAGRLQIVRNLGAGGMGVVFEVEHTLTKHRRALKLLHGEFARSAGIVTRFLREASAAGRIGNAHVVETFDAGRLDTGEPYIVMELLQGHTLADELQRRGTLPIVEACDILLQACDGMRAAHAAGIVHRDLKPENLFLLSGDRPFVKILDFGISKFDPALTGTHALTHEGMALGTPYYMPPEQVRGEKDIGVQADVYALGVILYECLTGERPYDAETLPHLAVLIYEGRYIPPTVRNPVLPQACDEVVTKALATDRHKRYANVDDFAADLETLRAALPSMIEGLRARQPAGARTNDMAASPADRITHGAAPAQTSGAFGQTQSVEPRRSGWLVVALVALGALLSLYGLSRWMGAERQQTAVELEPVEGAGSEPRTDALAARPAPPAVPKAPDVAPTLSGSVAAPVASVLPPPAVRGPVRSTDPKPQASSRARALGLSEENPF